MFNEKQLLLFADMLSKTLGDIAQITVSFQKHYIYVDNAIDESYQVGKPISDDELFFLENEQIQSLPYVVNYKSLSKDLKKLRSSTFLYKNEENEILYMLSVTMVVDSFIEVRNLIETFINGSYASKNSKLQVDSIPKISTSELDVEKLIENVITEGEKRFVTTVKRMTKYEKQSLIREMHSRGIFLIKGAVSIVAEQLSYSETTIYRYIKKLDEL